MSLLFLRLGRFLEVLDEVGHVLVVLVAARPSAAKAAATLHHLHGVVAELTHNNIQRWELGGSGSCWVVARLCGIGAKALSFSGCAREASGG